MSRLSSSTSRAEPGELRHAETDRNDYGDETECFSSGTSQGAALAGALVEFGRLTENPWEPLIVQRELEAAARCWQGDFDSKWWKWAIEVARSHGLAIRLMDLTISEVHALATHGGIALCRTEPIPTEPIPKVSAPSSKAAPELAERLFVVSGRKKRWPWSLPMSFTAKICPGSISSRVFHRLLCAVSFLSPISMGWVPATSTTSLPGNVCCA